MTAHKIHYWYQPQAARKLLLEASKGDGHAMHGLAQILYGTFSLETHEAIAQGLDIGVSIPCTVWRSIGLSPHQLDEIGLIRPGWQHYVQGNPDANIEGKCRRFKLDNSFLLRYLRICLENMDGPWVNVIDGATYKLRKFERSPKAKNKSGRPQCTARATINWAEGMAQAYELLRIAEAITSPKHRARAIQAIRCLQGIRSQPSFRMSRSQPGMASYVPVYHQVDCGGRWYELNSGYQGLPECIKAALLIGTDQVNSDLKSCHIAAAVALAGEINAHAAYLEHYELMVKGLEATPHEKKLGIYGVRDLLKMKSAYDRIAQAAELPRNVVKTCILSVLYGANTGAGIWRTREKKQLCSGAIMSTLMEHHDNDYRAARRSYKRLMPLLLHVVEFAQSLERAVSLVIDNPAWWRRCRGKLRQMVQVGYNGSVLNAVGTRIIIRGDDRTAMARRALSHILTGIEQDAIKHLLVVLRGEGIGVLHLEHDGLITDKAVPPVCVEYMVKHSLMSNYAYLEIKEFQIGTEDDLETLAMEINPAPKSTTTNTTNTHSQTPMTRGGPLPPLRCRKTGDVSSCSSDFIDFTPKKRASRNGNLLSETSSRERSKPRPNDVLLPNPELATHRSCVDGLNPLTRRSRP